VAYHHGDLRRELLAAAVAVITEQGPAAVSLRDLARRANVSHAAPTHHFGDKAGLLTAVAVEGYQQLAATLRTAGAQGGSFLDVGVAYVGFAVDHPAHFAVMFQPDLYHTDDPEVVTARTDAGSALYGGVRELPHPVAAADRQAAALAAWSLVHGLATLWLSGSLPAPVPADPRELARAVAAMLFRTTNDQPEAG
jgi:AcrR family transcriptional regulator